MKSVPVRVALTLRLSPQLHAQLTEAARDNGRSVNAELAQRLKQSLEGYRR